MGEVRVVYILNYTGTINDYLMNYNQSYHY